MSVVRDAVPQSAPRLAGAERAVLVVLAVGIVIIPTFFTSGADPFRLPKELLFRAEAIVLLAVAAFWLTGERRTWKLERRPEFLLAGAIVVWTLITVVASTNRQLSIDSFLTIIAAAIIFIATCLAARTRSFIAYDVLMIPSCINAALVILQELKIWTPFPPSAETATHSGSVGLLGNANDVGTFLLGPAVAAIVIAVVTSGVRRWTYAGISLLLAAGIAASGTRTALIALIASLVVFALVHSWRAAAAVAVILVLLALAVASPSTTIGRGIRQLVDAASHRNYEQLFSERLLPFLAAVEMTRDHPVFGIGPGCFRFHYMKYRVALPERYPSEWMRGFPMNWGEAHNDHLQVAAETGIPGYALFLAAIIIGTGIARRPAPQSPLVRALRWPLAAAVFVICLAQFPLELAAPRLMLLTLGALCINWDGDDAVS